MTKQKTKLLLCFFLVIAAAQALTTQQSERLEKWSKACREKSGVTVEMVKRFRASADIDTPEMRWHVFCVLVKAGLMNKKGEFVVEQVKSKLRHVYEDEDKVAQVAVKCAKKRRTPGETALLGYQCMHKMAPGFVIL
ncbi:PBP GOBP domain containing protein [Asbolus verrucosus]|uniref:PBP GOBP domain containing protein n=1 Tax=Asbolus verrucosus TaxID=1661398 RepID=A0A482WCL4_ASBVE|nr:PBP GOBP domain containing protein [Asbolus verrucosus]